jgi:hypothetical protein
MDKSRNPVILSVIHHRQNPLDSTSNLFYVKRYAPESGNLWSRVSWKIRILQWTMRTGSFWWRNFTKAIISCCSLICHVWYISEDDKYFLSEQRRFQYAGFERPVSPLKPSSESYNPPGEAESRSQFRRTSTQFVMHACPEQATQGSVMKWRSYCFVMPRCCKAIHLFT